MHVCLQCQKWHHVTIYLAINYCLSYAHSPTPQSKDAIVDSTHPCTREEAIQFAALQCQIQYGNYDEAKHKPGYLTLVNFLPQEYTKIKGIEKNIFTQHRKLHNLSEIDARVRYIQLCRSLKTYGMTFFLVKVK